MTVIGIEGMPSELNTAGNVVHKDLKLRLSMRTAPNCDCEALVEQLRRVITEAPEEVTFGARVEFEVFDIGKGFCAPELPQEMRDIVY